MRAYMAIYRGIYRPHRSSNKAYIAIYRSIHGLYIGVYIGYIGVVMRHVYAYI